MTLYVLNSLVVPVDFEASSEYVVKVRKITIDEAKRLLETGFVSAVGHESTAALLSSLLGVSIPVNRIRVTMKRGDKAIHFMLLERLPEGAVLSLEELLKLPYLLVLSEVMADG